MYKTIQITILNNETINECKQYDLMFYSRNDIYRPIETTANHLFFKNSANNVFYSDSSRNNIITRKIINVNFFYIFCYFGMFYTLPPSIGKKYYVIKDVNHTFKVVKITGYRCLKAQIMYLSTDF